MPEVLIDIDTGSPGCYCVCHSALSSRAWCEHCKGDNEVGRRYRERQRLERLVIEAAKQWRAGWASGAKELISAVEALNGFESNQQQIKK